ncbi:MAG: polysaccharide biosynthesis protein [Firmicutes bacterium]|nr:polysaccharide biosynthesis protein [Bacillota bacterium]
MADNTTKNLIRQGSFLVASQMIVRAINVLYRIPVTNLWGDKGLGIYSDAYQVYGFFLVFASLSIPTVISKMVGERLATGRYADVKKVLYLGTLLVGGIGFVSMLLMIFGGHYIATAFFSDPEATRPMQFLGPTVLLCSMMSILRGYFQGMNNMKPTAVSEVIEGLLHALFAVVLAFVLIPRGIEWSVTGGIIGTGIGAVGSFLFLAFMYASQLAKQTEKEHASDGASMSAESTASIYRQMLSLMIPIVISSTVFSVKGIIDATMFGKIMLSMGDDPGHMVAMRGIYSGKFIVLLNLPVAIGEALGAAAVPSIAGSRARGDEKALHEHFASMIRTVLLITVPCAVGLAVLGKPAMHLLFAHANQGGELFWIGSLAVVSYSLSYIAGGVLNGLNLSYISMIHAAIGVVVSSLWNLIGLRVFHLGIYTLALNALLFSSLIMVLNLRSAMKHLNVRMNFFKLAKGPVISSLLMGIWCVFSYVAAFALTGSNVISVVVSIGLGVLAYFFLGVNLHLLDPKDLENLPGGSLFRLFMLKD